MTTVTMKSFFEEKKTDEIIFGGKKDTESREKNVAQFFKNRPEFG